MEISHEEHMKQTGFIYNKLNKQCKEEKAALIDNMSNFVIQSIIYNRNISEEEKNTMFNELYKTNKAVAEAVMISLSQEPNISQVERELWIKKTTELVYTEHEEREKSIIAHITTEKNAWLFDKLDTELFNDKQNDRALKQATHYTTNKEFLRANYIKDNDKLKVFKRELRQQILHILDNNQISSSALPEGVSYEEVVFQQALNTTRMLFDNKNPSVTFSAGSSFKYLVNKELISPNMTELTDKGHTYINKIR